MGESVQVLVLNSRTPSPNHEPRTPNPNSLQVRDVFDLPRLALFTGSGRAVGAIIRLAIGLCRQRCSRLTQTVLDDAIAVWANFHEDLTQVGATDTWDD